MKKQAIIKRIHKLSPKKNDILIVTLKDYYNGQSATDIHNQVRILIKDAVLPNTKAIILDERVRVRYQDENKGKHAVYLNNLEYLEYLNNKQEE